VNKPLSQTEGAVRMRKWRSEHPEENRLKVIDGRVTRMLYNRGYYKDNTQRIYDYRLGVKTEVLAHYGKKGELKCCWQDCEITDVDILTLDHVNNDGAQERRTRPNNNGASFYIRLRYEGYPNGFQTLCCNHQWKKEILRRRTERGEK
jgi:hypothetical protein